MLEAALPRALLRPFVPAQRNHRWHTTSACMATALSPGGSIPCWRCSPSRTRPLLMRRGRTRVSAGHVCLYRVCSVMDDAHATDPSLLARIAQHDPKALDLLYTRHARAVFSLARTMLGEHVRATDLTQDVFLCVWRSAGTYQPTGSARAWLLRLTRNRAIDELRRDRRRLANEAILLEQSFQTLPAPLALVDTNLTMSH